MGEPMSNAGPSGGSGVPPRPANPPNPAIPPDPAPQPAPTPDPDGARRGGAPAPTRRLGEVAALISALAAVFGVLLGFFGLPTVLRSPTAMPPTAAPQPTATVTLTVTAPAPAPSGEPPGESGSAASTSPSGAEVVRTASFELAEHYGFDLEDDPLRPANRDDMDFDYYTTSGTKFRSQRGARMILLKHSEKGSYRTCSTVTRYTTEIDPYGLAKGGQICILAANGLVALVDISRTDDPSPDNIPMKITVWSGTYE
jgi:hypothetical protein